jgi:hypothetical protein
MDLGLLHLHNILRWVILILLLVAIVKSFSGMSGNRPYTNGDRKVGLFLMISAHIMLLIGLYQVLAGRYGLITKGVPDDIMENPVNRFFLVEHPVLMIIAIVLITIGRGQAKKNISDHAKHKKSFWLYVVALILILASVPWPFREEIARPLFPGATL